MTLETIAWSLSSSDRGDLIIRYLLFFERCSSLHKDMLLPKWTFQPEPFRLAQISPAEWI